MKKKIKELIEKFLSGTCSEEELALLRQYFEINHTEELEALLKNDWDTGITTAIPTSLEDKNWKELIDKLQVKQLNPTQSSRNNTLQILKYAAIFLGFISVSIYAYKYFDKSSPVDDVLQVTIELEDGTVKNIEEVSDPFIKNTEGQIIAEKQLGEINYQQTNAKEELVYNTIHIPYGKTFKVFLSDGSEIILNAGSSLKYPVKFLKSTPREVFLEGEGFFKITKDSMHPFIVHSNALKTAVYGTVFNVSSYSNEERIEVTLIEGSVGVYKESDAADLKKLVPNQLASYSKINEQVEIKDQVAIEKYIAWIDGVLLFKNDQFNDIIKKLERHYNITVTNNYKEIENERFTGRFEIEGIEEVFATFKRTIPFTYVKKNNEIIINP